MFWFASFLIFLAIKRFGVHFHVNFGCGWGCLFPTQKFESRKPYIKCAVPGMKFLIIVFWEFCSFKSNVPFPKLQFSQHIVIVIDFQKVLMESQSEHLSECPSFS